jgi:FkbM family methyltransferase
MFNRHFVRDLMRTRRINRYEREHGTRYHYHGLDIDLPAAAGIGTKNAILRDRYERAEITFIEKYLPSDLPVIELGGSLGVISRCIGSRLSAETTQIVVEANPNIFDICGHNAVLPGREAVTVLVNKAVAYGADSVSFEVSANVHENRLSSGSRNVDTVTVDAVTLRALVNETIGEQTFVAIMDIEGGEFDIIENDLPVFERCNLAIIEIHPQYFDSPDRTFDRVIGRLADVGLKLAERDDDVFVFLRSPAT